MYDIRREATKHLVEQHKLTSDQLLPLHRWAIGTLFLVMLAWIFTQYMRRAASHHVEYRKQLIDMSPSFSGIKEGIPIGGTIHRLHYYLFFAFPLFDVALWTLFYVGRRFIG